MLFDRIPTLRLLSAGLIVMLLSGCGVKLAPGLQQDPPGAPSLAQVRQNPDAHRSSPVRWGGFILEAENRDAATWVTIVALELDGNGRPFDRDRTLGRFIAVVDEFLEPSTYRRDRLITVSGVVDGLSRHKVGEFQYDYPLVKVDAHHLWARLRKAPLHPYPSYYWPYRYWYHPIYNPFPHPHIRVPHVH